MARFLDKLLNTLKLILIGFWIFVSAVFSIVAPFAGICLFGIAALHLKFTRELVFSKTKIKLPRNQRIILSGILLFAFLFLLVKQIDHDELKKFHKKKPQIIAQITKNLESKNYKIAIESISKYEKFNDNELAQLLTKAKFLKFQSESENKVAAILEKLKTLPSLDYEKNQKLYKKLVLLRPQNSEYKTKLSYYTKLEKRRQIIEAKFSPWDGSHIKLEYLIKKTMNDPDSYKHAETIYWDNGSYLLVKTTFRGRNVFGGMVINSVTAKCSLDGDVVEIIKQDQ